MFIDVLLDNENVFQIQFMVAGEIDSNYFYSSNELEHSE